MNNEIKKLPDADLEISDLYGLAKTIRKMEILDMEGNFHERAVYIYS
ncbi:hypothetical protein [Paenibacillus sp. FSL H7-0918]|jgi:hypothetical protein